MWLVTNAFKPVTSNPYTEGKIQKAIIIWYLIMWVWELVWYKLANTWWNKLSVPRPGYLSQIINTQLGLFTIEDWHPLSLVFSPGCMHSKGGVKLSWETLMIDINF